MNLTFSWIIYRIRAGRPRSDATEAVTSSYYSNLFFLWGLLNYLRANWKYFFEILDLSRILRSMLRVSWSGVSAGFTRMLSSSALPSMDCYRTLGVSRTASDADIKKRYLELVKQYHPDKNGSHDDFVKIQSAYEVLRNEEMNMTRRMVRTWMKLGRAELLIMGGIPGAHKLPGGLTTFLGHTAITLIQKNGRQLLTTNLNLMRSDLYEFLECTSLLFLPCRGRSVSNLSGVFVSC